MWSRQIILVWIFTLTILNTQSHDIQKRGLLSKLFGQSTKSTGNVDTDMSPRERSKFRELLSNPVVVTMLTAAVGMAVQQALAAKNMNDICDNKYVKMAYMAGNLNPQLQQIINLLGCNGPNRKYTSGGQTTNKYGVSTTPSYNNNNNDEDDEDNEQDTNDNEDDNLESAFTPEKKSKLQHLVNISRGQKGAKREFLKSLFGLGKKDKTFKQGQKLPSSSYKLDKDDAKAMKDFEKEVAPFH